MNAEVAPVRRPDLSGRPLDLVAEHVFAVRAAALYEAWTRGFDRWFAAPGSVLMRAEVNAVFFFETEFKPDSQSVAQRHPHYGRFLRLIVDQLVEITWVTGPGGTDGVETIVTVELQAASDTRGGPLSGTRLRLTHAGFLTAAARDRHKEAWPMVLAQLEKRLTPTGER